MINNKTFKTIYNRYRKQWGLKLCVTDSHGFIIHGKALCKSAKCESECKESRVFAINEGLRWGEATALHCPGGYIMWCVPLMINSEVTGGLLTGISEKKLLGFDNEGALFDLRGACQELRMLAEEFNLTNAAALEIARGKYVDEQKRAYVLHASKVIQNVNIRELYMREEPQLFSAIRSGDRDAAREILNVILLYIYSHAGNRIESVKSFVMELVISMCRTAVEVGGDPQELLGENFKVMTALSGIKSDEKLTQWIIATFNRLFDSIEKNRNIGATGAIFDAIAFIERHCCEQITRDDAAFAAHLSPQYFSTILKQETGTGFTELLNRMRVDRACDIILKTDKSLLIVAMECGFQDQSYFTKVFKKYRKKTPLQFKKENK